MWVRQITVVLCDGQANHCVTRRAAKCAPVWSHSAAVFDGSFCVAQEVPWHWRIRFERFDAHLILYQH
jgi:hypothetical protein